MDATGKEGCKVKNLRKARLLPGPDGRCDAYREYNRFNVDMLAEKDCGKGKHGEKLHSTLDREPFAKLSRCSTITEL